MSEDLRGFRFRLSSADRIKVEKERGLSTEDLLRALVAEIEPLAQVPVSDFRVGAAGINGIGEIFLGVNLEFAGTSFAQTVHAEQFLVSLSRTHSASPLSKVAVSAPPCGHCRQFFTEFDPDGSLELLIGAEPRVKMTTLLPRAFSPADLNVAEPFYSEPPEVSELTDMESAARAAAMHSYVPYSGTQAGAAVRSHSGEIFVGAALENAAYNPALPPLQAAIVSAYAGGCRPKEIREVVLCQKKEGSVDYDRQLRDLAQTLAIPNASFKTIYF